MTGYYLSIGYMSGYSGFDGTAKDAWTTFVNIVEILRRQTDRIVAEVQRVEPQAEGACECCTVRELTLRYAEGDRQVNRTPNPGVCGRDEVGRAEGTLIIDHEGETVIQIASGDRVTKEAVRRAFCRLAIEDGHRAGLEIELRVC